MKYLKAIDPNTGLICGDKVWAVADDGTQTIVTSADAAWLDYVKGDLTTQIDAKVADVYSKWMRFSQEYLERQDAAQNFKDAGYAGDPGPWVTAFAVPAGKTNQQAADLILAQSVMLNGALATLGALRMRKYEIIGATDATAAQAAYDDIVAKIDATAAQIQ